MRSGKIEFRWSKINQLHELVEWHESDTCYAIAFFRKDSEGYDMKTVGSRFFEAPKEDAWLVAKHAMSFLNAMFDKEVE